MGTLNAAPIPCPIGNNGDPQRCPNSPPTKPPFLPQFPPMGRTPPGPPPPHLLFPSFTGAAGALVTYGCSGWVGHPQGLRWGGGGGS